jgi:hypothetical protein
MEPPKRGSRFQEQIPLRAGADIEEVFDLGTRRRSARSHPLRDATEVLDAIVGVAAQHRGRRQQRAARCFRARIGTRRRRNPGQKGAEVLVLDRRLPSGDVLGKELARYRHDLLSAERRLVGDDAALRAHAP